MLLKGIYFLVIGFHWEEETNWDMESFRVNTIVLYLSGLFFNIGIICPIDSICPCGR